MDVKYYNDNAEFDKERASWAKLKLKKAYLSKNGLNIAEIMVLSRVHKFKSNQTQFPSFFYSHYGIDSVPEIIDKLILGGFVDFASAEDSFEGCTIPELKEYLSLLSLSKSGNKKDMISRLKSKATHEQLEDIVKIRLFVLTELGKTELNENEYVPFLDSHPYLIDGIDVWWMNKKLHDYPNMKYMDIIWGELNSRLLKSMEKIPYNSYGEYIHIKSEMSDFLFVEGRYKDSLFAICEAMYRKLNFVAFPHILDCVQSNITKGYEYNFDDSEMLMIDESRLKKLFLHLETDKEGLYQMILDCSRRFYSEKAPFPIGTFAALLVSAAADEKDETDKAFQKLVAIIRKQVIQSNNN